MAHVPTEDALKRPEGDSFGRRAVREVDGVPHDSPPHPVILGCAVLALARYAAKRPVPTDARHRKSGGAATFYAHRRRSSPGAAGPLRAAGAAGVSQTLRRLQRGGSPALRRRVPGSATTSNGRIKVWVIRRYAVSAQRRSLPSPRTRLSPSSASAGRCSITAAGCFNAPRGEIPQSSLRGRG
jgi:hypothetical protein